MHHPHTAMRPAVPEGTYGRRRAGSIVPAVPSMSNITAHHYIQPPTPLAPTIPIQQPPSPPICTAQQLEPIVAREYFKPPLPWYSAPGPFPRRHRRRRRQLPLSQPHPTSPRVDEPTIAPPATPPTVTPPSEFDSTHPTTPSSTAPPSTTASVATKLVPSTPPAVPVVVPRSKAVKVQSISTNASKSDAGTAPVTPTTQSESPLPHRLPRPRPQSPHPGPTC
ncbi:hypothetical protein BDD12DRAFT_510075 [Trichophaea hybrida]|nr:hypothetical protein BDD12DRAFT_510075 [Trichophaea hybrida]